MRSVSCNDALNSWECYIMRTRNMGRKYVPTAPPKELWEYRGCLEKYQSAFSFLHLMKKDY